MCMCVYREGTGEDEVQAGGLPCQAAAAGGRGSPWPERELQRSGGKVGLT